MDFDVDETKLLGTSDKSKKKVADSTNTLIGVYVDDLLVTGTTFSEVNRFLEDMCVLENHGYHLEQAQSICELLTGLRLEQADPPRSTIGEEQDGEGEEDPLPSDGEASQGLEQNYDLLAANGDVLSLL
uniref:AlNc14C10G1226 protein n=1 Tax=Albugo laibachii Nc14 TaxID=890382 RepID=F0W2H9_9STRA|nr:AlNc14C10G1226 [Albugo laibachii Nc14]|eukprot:CCA15265.1 AlNc14C10G1226 [Albugo laibachii Nc14]